MRVPFVIVVAATVLGGCAEAPFAYREIENTLDKPPNTVLTEGRVTVCHADGTPWAQIEAVAADACGEYGYFPRYQYSDRYQCRISAPHRARFQCYHPEMTDTKGQFISPANTAAIDAWEKRTGKIRPKPRVALPEAQQQAVPATLPEAPKTTPTAPESAGTGSGAPTSAAPAYRPLSPADIAGKPAIDPAPIVTSPTQPAPAYPANGGYSLPPGSWGQHFEE